MEHVEHVDPTLLTEDVEREIKDSRCVLCAYWIKVQGNRDTYATAIKATASSWPIVPIIVRKQGFDSPNSVFQDLMGVVHDERSLFEDPSLRALTSKCGRIAIILIARTELSVPQAHSPARVPDWFPVAPGEQISVYLKDKTWDTNVPLKSSDAKSAHVAKLLYEIEGALQNRLEIQLATDRNRIAGLLERLRGDQSTGSFSDILQAAKSYRDTVSDPEAFRPSRKDAKCITARLWDIYMRNGPEQLQQYAKAFATALQPNLQPHNLVMPIQALIARPSTPIKLPTGTAPDPQIQWAVALIISVGTAFQFLTAVAHSDQYPRYPSSILRAFSLDVRKFLQDAISVLHTSETTSR